MRRVPDVLLASVGSCSATVTGTADREDCTRLSLAPGERPDSCIVRPRSMGLSLCLWKIESASRLYQGHSKDARSNEEGSAPTSARTDPD